MRLMITRPLEDAGPLADVLRGRGIDALVEPLLHIDLAAGPALDLSDVQALLITSANGARAVAARTVQRDVRVFAVGDASARACRDLGFDDVLSAGGDVDDLARLVALHATPADGVLLHAAGSAVAGDLKGYLDDAGFTYRRAVLYRATTATALSDDGRAALASGALDGVMFFSPRTAATFGKLVDASMCSTLTAYCLSPAVAEKISVLPWARIVVAPRPEQDALVSTLELD